jgi:hypothetical protein
MMGHVADTGIVVLIVRVELLGLSDHLAVERVLLALFDFDDAGLVASGRDDDSLAKLPAVALDSHASPHLSLRLGGRVTLGAKLAGTQLGVQACDVLLYGRDAPGVVELTGGQLEPEARTSS